jgi:hypothetical protein
MINIINSLADEQGKLCDCKGSPRKHTTGFDQLKKIFNLHK